MPFADLHIPGVAGPVSTDYSFWSGFRFFVDGQRVKPQGFPRNRLTLPGVGGPGGAEGEAPGNPGPTPRVGGGGGVPWSWTVVSTRPVRPRRCRCRSSRCSHC